jgi:hypothetical protein
VRNTDRDSGSGSRFAEPVVPKPGTETPRVEAVIIAAYGYRASFHRGIPLLFLYREGRSLLIPEKMVASFFGQRTRSPRNVKFNQWSVREVPFPEAAASVCRRGQVLPTAGPKMARSGWSTDASDGSVTCTTGGAQDVPRENIRAAGDGRCSSASAAGRRWTWTAAGAARRTNERLNVEQDIFLQCQVAAACVPDATVTAFLSPVQAFGSAFRRSDREERREQGQASVF